MTTKTTARNSIIRGCLSRYKLALKAASRITTLDRETYFDDYNDTDDDSADSNYAFIISEHLTTPGNGHHALHNWIFRKLSGIPTFDIWKKVKVIIPSFFSITCLFPSLLCLSPCPSLHYS